MNAGYIVVCTGGGGVPVFEKDGAYSGVPAVIDKVLANAEIKTMINAFGCRPHRHRSSG